MPPYPCDLSLRSLRRSPHGPKQILMSQPSCLLPLAPSGPLIGGVRRHPSDLRSRAIRFGAPPYHCDLNLRSLRGSPQRPTQILMSRPSCVSITWLCFPIRFSHSLSPPRLPPPLVSQDPRSSTLWACLFLRFCPQLFPPFCP